MNTHYVGEMHTIGHTDLLHPSPAPHKVVLQMQHSTSFFIKFKSNFLVRAFFLLNADFTTAIMDLISCAHLDVCMYVCIYIYIYIIADGVKLI